MLTLMVEAEELVCLVLHRGQIFGCRLTIVERFGKNVKWRSILRVADDTVQRYQWPQLAGQQELQASK
jgi:hypothetical protein